MKKLIATTILATAIAAPSFAAGNGGTVSNTVSAASDKIQQGYQNTRAAVHETMANSNISSTEAEMKSGNTAAAAEDAADAASHKSAAADARAKAAAHKKAADKKMNHVSATTR